MSLYEVLKASKTQQFPDYWTLLWGRKLSASMIKTITGTLPLTFTAKGGNAVDWVIYGNDDNGTENLFDGTYSESGKELASNGTTITSENWSITQYISIVGGEKYTVCNGMVVGSAIAACFYDADKTYISGFSYNAQANITVTAPANARYIRATVLSNPEHQKYNADVFMIVKAPTAPDHYIPYQQGVGERTAQLFDINNVTENYYLNNGVPTQINVGGYVLSDYIPIASNTTTISAKCTKKGGGSHWAVYDENKTYIRGGIAFLGSEIGTVLAKSVDTSGAAFIRVDYALEFITDCMLNLGSTALPYAPYGYKLPFTVSQQGQTDKNYDIYIGDSSLTEGETISKTSTGVDIELFEGENTVSTTLTNKPEMTIRYK